jgi:GGDEF domain-containing protein
MQGRKALDEAIDELRARDIPHAAVAIDLQNLGAINHLLGHDGANTIIKDVAIDNVQNGIHQIDGEVYRTGGDEFFVLVPEKNAAQVRTVMQAAAQSIEKNVVQKNGFENLPHPKLGGLPTGAGRIDYGIADSTMAKDRSSMLKIADLQSLLTKEIFKDIVVEKERQQGRIWHKDEVTQSYTLVNKEKGAEHVNTITERTTSSERDNRFYAGRSSEIRNGDRGSNYDRSGKSTNGDGKSVIEKSGIERLGQIESYLIALKIKTKEAGFEFPDRVYEKMKNGLIDGSLTEAVLDDAFARKLESTKDKSADLSLGM